MNLINEKQVTYMRGLFKNFVALDKLKQNVADEYKILNADNQNYKVFMNNAKTIT